MPESYFMARRSACAPTRAQLTMPVFNRRSVTAKLRAARAVAHLTSARLAHRLHGAPAPVVFVLVSDEAAYTSEQQFAPMWRHASALRRRYGVVFRHELLRPGDALDLSSLEGAQIVGVKLGFRTPAAEAVATVDGIRRALDGRKASVVYFDGDDDLCIEWPEVLALADLYVKKHLFVDPAAQQRRYVGKSNLTDFVARTTGRSFADNEITSSGPVDVRQLPKLWLGWNIGLDDKIAALAAETRPVDHATKDIDIGSRAFVSPQVWIEPLRSPVIDRLETLSERFRVLAPRERVSQEQYYDEMRRARICVSPYGYGELCWRDFEAVLCGCLLVKPDMGHARTWPDLFVDGETYAAVQWDYADLEAVCARFLADEAARRRVADRARHVLLDALGESAFVERFGAMLQQLRQPAVPT